MPQNSAVLEHGEDFRGSGRAARRNQEEGQEPWDREAVGGGGERTPASGLSEAV